MGLKPSNAKHKKKKKNLLDDDLPHQLHRYLLTVANKQQQAGGQTSPVGWTVAKWLPESLRFFLTEISAHPLRSHRLEHQLKPRATRITCNLEDELCL